MVVIVSGSGSERVSKRETNVSPLSVVNFVFAYSPEGAVAFRSRWTAWSVFCLCSLISGGLRPGNACD